MKKYEQFLILKEDANATETSAPTNVPENTEKPKSETAAKEAPAKEAPAKEAPAKEAPAKEVPEEEKVGLAKDRGDVKELYHPETKKLALKIVGILKDVIDKSDYNSKNYENSGGFKNGILVYPYDSQKKIDVIKIMTKAHYGKESQDLDIDKINRFLVSSGLKVLEVSTRPDYPGLSISIINKDYVYK